MGNCWSAANWLKDLPNRVVLKPKREWSEEDEYHIRSIESTIKYCIKEVAENEDAEYLFKEDLDWLKSLRPQNHWKPSEEQMEALDGARFGKTDPIDRGALDKLYVQLKKLKEN